MMPMPLLLQTERLYIKDIALTDIASIHALHSLPETDEFNTLGIPATIAVTEKLVNEWIAVQTQNPRTVYVFALSIKATQAFIGLMALNLGKSHYKTAEIWFKVHKDFWNKAYTTEAVTQLLDFGFNDLKLHRIEAGCATENMASAKVLEKVGMTREGMKRKKLPIRGEWKDNYFYAILEEDFFK
jgi:[ribosomal protein S5]-alanine N-acetyltransferase